MHTHGLTHYDEFREIIEKYTMSERAKNALVDLKLVLLVGPTSSGRNTVLKELVKNENYYFVVSDTTRPPQKRDGKIEENGVNYFFRTEEEMLADLKAGEFFEAELIHNQQVSGISIRELEKAKSLNKIAATDVDIGGVNNVLKAKPDTTIIYLIPPSFEEWQQRIRSRGLMSEIEYRRRLQTAEAILKDGLRPNNHYHFVISENISQTAAIINDIAHGKHNPHQGRGESLINVLLDRLHQKLDTNLL
jgi:guanylate kinase